MIINVYNKYPDRRIKIVKKTEMDNDGWGMQAAQEGGDDDHSHKDGCDQKGLFIWFMLQMFGMGCQWSSYM